MAGRGGRTIWRSMARALVALILLGSSWAGSAQAPPARDLAAYQLARDAYVYAYPIVIMDTTMRQATNVPSTGTLVNGWAIQTENVGTYGTSYKERAMIALAGLRADLPEDAIYPTAFFDAAGQPLSGANSYVRRFDKGGLPPINAFWSITMYDKDGFQVPNPINRFALGDRDRLTFNPDGSLDIYVQAKSPGPDKESNWLPAPKDAPFHPTMRLYSPKPEATDGTWAPPGVSRIN